MRNSTVFLLVLLQITFSMPVGAEDLAHGQVHLEECMSNALAVQHGRVIKVEMKIEDDDKVYEFDIRDTSGSDWDIECHADTGQIIETEREVSSLISSEFKDKIN